MAPRRILLQSLAVVAAVALPGANAGFSSSSRTNIAVYWGQNSYGQAGSQERLAYYCSNTDIDIIPLAFMDMVSTPIVNFANAGDNCTTFSGTQLLDCPQLETDIAECQRTYGKTILLSIGGATYTEGGFATAAAAAAAAQSVWAMFGPAQAGGSARRPFGAAVVDGFDLDLEAPVQHMAAFGRALRARMTAATAAGGKAYFLSAAPQCPYPDAAGREMLDGAVWFDWVQVQFYNNYCGVGSFVPGAAAQASFDFAAWHAWARHTSANPGVKILLGIPASASAAGSGYTTGPALAAAIEYSATFDSFGGVMMWDMSQLYENSGYLADVVADLGSAGDPSPTTTATTLSTSSTSTTAAETTATTTTVPAATVTGVPQWGQCGGIGYAGSTTCASPYSCVYLSEWWAQCD